MTPRKIWANLAVENVERTNRFYTTLGFKANGKPTAELTSFLAGDDNFVIHFFNRETLEANLKRKTANLDSGTEVVFTLGAESKEQVNAWQQDVIQAGGNIISAPEEFGEGYYGFTFSDPDGHQFNVFYMKGLF